MSCLESIGNGCIFGKHRSFLGWTILSDERSHCNIMKCRILMSVPVTVSTSSRANLKPVCPHVRRSSKVTVRASTLTASCPALII